IITIKNEYDLLVIYMKKICSFILAALTVFIFPLSCFAEETSDNDVVEDFAKSSILICADTGDIIYEKNAYEQLSPASITKIMSMLLILEALDSGKISLDDEVTAGENAVAMGGSQIWLELGEKMTVDELLKAVIIASANDACTALGEYVAGSDSAFVSMMNDKAKELGLKNTNFENCTGLDDTVKNHYSSAYDLAVIAGEVMKHDLVKNYTTIWLDYLRGGKTELNNTNKLVNKYNGITGLKTGTTSKAGFCVCATAQRDGMSLIAVVLGAETSEQRFQSAENLLDYGFANYQVIVPLIDESKITAVTVKNGVEKSITPVYSDSDKVLVKKGSGEISYEYKIDKTISAPVKKGETLGEICIYSDETLIKSIKLYSSKEVGKVSLNYILIEMLRNI
ncbi:MAG: D-alanyl-D-alanine carboxypeptidase, partial [Clostridiales bacterium]|nr:D-alanyl-D-alanine carboxypeptidase [Clostridiales bacterium]